MIKVTIALNNINLGESLKILRSRRGVTLRDLADQASTSASTLSRFENGKENVALSTIQAAFLSLGYDIQIKLTPTQKIDYLY